VALMLEREILPIIPEGPGCLSMVLAFLTSSCNMHDSSLVWNSFDDCYC